MRLIPLLFACLEESRAYPLTGYSILRQQGAEAYSKSQYDSALPLYEAGGELVGSRHNRSET